MPVLKHAFISKTSFALSLLALSIIPLSTAQAETLKIDTDKSQVSWTGKKLTGQHNGTVKLSDGTIEVEGDKIVAGSFKISLGSIVNLDLEDPAWNTKLVNHLKSEDFFNIAAFPDATFSIKSVEGELSSGEVTITGDLAVKDIAHSITFPAAVMKHGELWHATAKLNIDRTLWDIRYNSGKFFDANNLGDKLIYDDIEIGLEILTK
ncbi:MAG: YceI family protein [bacterium]|nr:YceI family protein [bacterium]